MGIRTSYPPGTFSWVDLATTDPAGARAFYTELFGWTVDGDVEYSVWRVDGAAVCAFALMPSDTAVGIPPGWTKLCHGGERRRHGNPGRRARWPCRPRGVRGDRRGTHVAARGSAGCDVCGLGAARTRRCRTRERRRLSLHERAGHVRSRRRSPVLRDGLRLDDRAGRHRARRPEGLLGSQRSRLSTRFFTRARNLAPRIGGHPSPSSGRMPATSRAASHLARRVRCSLGQKPILDGCIAVVMRPGGRYWATA